MYRYTAALLPAFAAAHFQMLYPHSRGFSENTIPQYPCGGFDKVQTNRTNFPMSGGPIQLNMEHTDTNVEVLIAFGNNPGPGDYHTVLIPTFFERGPESFCMGDIIIPGAKAGQNATIQVQTNGDPNGGLYACADVTLVSTPLAQSVYSANCKNSTGVTVQALNTQANANETEAGKGGTTSGGSTTSAASGSSTAAPASSSSGLGSMATANVMGAFAAGVVGLVGVAAAL